MFKDKVQESIDNIRQLLAGHGGDIQLVSVDEANGKVEVQLMGACNGCPHAAQTMKHGVEEILKKDVPEIKEVIAV